MSGRDRRCRRRAAGTIGHVASEPRPSPMRPSSGRSSPTASRTRTRRGATASSTAASASTGSPAPSSPRPSRLGARAGAGARRSPDRRGEDGGGTARHRRRAARDAGGRPDARSGGAVAPPAPRPLPARRGRRGRRRPRGGADHGLHLRLRLPAHAPPGVALRPGRLRRVPPPAGRDVLAGGAALPGPLPAGADGHPRARGRPPRRAGDARRADRLPPPRGRPHGRLPGGLRRRADPRRAHRGRAAGVRRGAPHLPRVRRPAGHPRLDAGRLVAVHHPLVPQRRRAGGDGGLPAAPAARLRGPLQADLRRGPAAPAPPRPGAAVHRAQRHGVRVVAALPGAHHHAPGRRSRNAP